MFSNKDHTRLSSDVATFETDTKRMLEDYLDAAQLASELEVSERTLARWHAMRLGPPRVTIGRRPLYRRASVTAWIERQERDPAATAGGGRRRRA